MVTQFTKRGCERPLRGGLSRRHRQAKTPCTRHFRGVVLGYRYYNPSLGRWLSRDPINEKGFQLYAGRDDWFYAPEEKSLYAFVGNDPNDYYDLEGLLVEECKIAVATGATAAAAIATLPAEAVILGTVVSAGIVYVTYKVCTGQFTCGKHCRKCDPIVGTTMYRTDRPPSRAHWINGVKEPIHTHHSVVTQRSVNANVEPCKCELDETDVTRDASPRANEIPERKPTGGGVTWFSYD